MGIDTLGALRLHPTFVMYLYLRVQQRAGQLASASAKSDELLKLIEMPGNPIKPYYFPLIDRGKRTGKPLATFWRAENISGSWSPGSIRRQQGGGWLGANESAYAWPDNHAELALSQMLYGKRVSALSLGAYFLRNDGFVLSADERRTTSYRVPSQVRLRERLRLRSALHRRRSAGRLRVVRGGRDLCPHRRGVDGCLRNSFRTSVR